MKTLSYILPTDIEVTEGDLNIEIAGITFDSRQVKRGYLFVALPGQYIDGSAFIFDAIEHGAVAVLMESRRKNIEVPVVIVKNARKALSEVSSKFFDQVTEKMRLFGITGTKGKTTTSYLIQSILKKAFGSAFCIGTIGYDIGTKKISAKNTTPESIVLHELMDSALKNGIKHGVVEVSSHALRNWRTENVAFAVAGFTNMSLEHTEFHSSMDDYFDTKKRLFTEIARKDKPCLIGVDDDYGRRMAEECKAAGCNVKTISICQTNSDYFVENIRSSTSGSDFIIVHDKDKLECHISLPGKFNVFNALMAASMTHEDGVRWSDIINGIKELKHVPGRLEKIPNNSGINVMVDYAHSPAALENVLKTLRPITENKLITVFGCGGNRSHEKRPIMGKIALQHSDIVIVTSDNPRKEQPEIIIEQIMQGILLEKEATEKQIIQEIDRKTAIFRAMSFAKSGDTVLIAGKGHESGQIFADKVLPFDDCEVARSYFRKDGDE